MHYALHYYIVYSATISPYNLLIKYIIPQALGPTAQTDPLPQSHSALALGYAFSCALDDTAGLPHPRPPAAPDSHRPPPYQLCR